MSHSHYNVVVIGGGPAGSALSTLLVQQGYSVLLLEREKFPRFHVGESLLPTTQRIWEKLGIAEQMQHLNHTFKYAGEFRFGLDPQKSDYEYSRNCFNNSPRNLRQERPYAYQVNRSEFDLFLLNHARAKGVVVLEEATVKEVLWDNDKATGIRWRIKDGTEYTTQADCLADCSGRHALIARRKQLLVPNPDIKTSAVFGQFKGIQRDPGIRQGYFNGYFIENGWIWFIPLNSDVMSIGVVMNAPGNDWWSKKSPEEILLTYINRYKFIRDRFKQTEQVSKVRMLRGLPYSSKRSVGEGWILVGDANFFVDPLYSSGVHVAFHSAEKAADAIDTFLRGNRNMQSLKNYEKWSTKYQFHIFTSIGILYKMLKYRVAIELYIKMTGRYSNHWDNFILRRVNAWGTGHFDRYYWAVYLTWIAGYFLVGLGALRKMLFGIPDWDTHTEFCSEPPIRVPKSQALFSNEKGVGYSESPTPVQDAIYSEQWIVPSDSVNMSSSASNSKSSEGVKLTSELITPARLAKNLGPLNTNSDRLPSSESNAAKRL